jgi:hypothetical protein
MLADMRAATNRNTLQSRGAINYLAVALALARGPAEFYPPAQEQDLFLTSKGDTDEQVPVHY